MRHRTSKSVWYAICELFDQVECTGAVVDSITQIELVEDTMLSFVEREATLGGHAAGVSALCAFSFLLPETQPVDVFVDRLFAGLSDLMFANGFETGDTSAWSAVVP